MSMAWLPPLNSHDNYKLHVRAYKRAISHHQIPRSFRHLRHHCFFIDLLHTVVFYSQSDIKFENPFPGLTLHDLTPIHVSFLDSCLREIFLHDPTRTPFALHPSCWTASPSPPECLATDQELLHKIADFVPLIDSEPKGGDLKLLALDITKVVVVPEEEFKSWVDWYQAQKRLSPSFEMKYMKAIHRPRELADLYQEAAALSCRRPARASCVRELEVVVASAAAGESCGICLEEFGEEEEAKKLPCRHLFHDECIGRWLGENNCCPFCRHQLPSADY